MQSEGERMNYTNKANLPEPMVKALMFDDYEHKGNISVTGLITPPRIYQLLKRHDKEIIIDVLNNFWSMLGKAMHLILDQYAEKSNVLSEERIYMNINGWKVGAKPDLWEPPATLGDYKFTSVWTVIYGLKPEWEAQMNCYRPFYDVATFFVEQMKIYVLGRDWSRTKSLQDPKYPKYEISVLPVPMWNMDDIWKFMEERIQLHQQCENLADDELPYCTPEERWEKKTTWAVMKEGRKKAVRVFDDKDKMIDYYMHFTDDKKYSWVERPGESTRCEHYCPVKGFCNQYKLMKEEKHG